MCFLFKSDFVLISVEENSKVLDSVSTVVIPHVVIHDCNTNIGQSYMQLYVMLQKCGRVMPSSQ